LNRAKTDEYGYSSKLSTPYKFDEVLDLNKYIERSIPDRCRGEYVYINDIKTDDEINTKNNYIYHLHAIGCHSGSLSGGHYIAYTKHGNNWYCCNDSSVSRVDRKVYFLYTGIVYFI
jgi:ubiquitin C-terminal hydrolase